MRRNGNTNSNRRYNPSNTKAQIPLDVDEVDSALEKYMRQKYDLQLFSGGARRPAVRHDTGETGSTRSSDDMPPPLPPKPGKRFGFGLRSVSSALPLGRNSHVSPPTSPDTYGANTPPLRVNKQSRVFGATVGGGQNDAMEAKMASLREMGFIDDKRNAHVLKGLNGNVERAVETLIRLGEGGGSVARNSIYVQTRSSSQSASASKKEPIGLSKIQPETIPEQEGSRQGSSQATHGAQDIHQTVVPGYPASRQGSQSYNPFDNLDSKAPNTAPLENSFANMQISQPSSQPLFPNATGGYPMQQPSIPDARLQHSMTPPVPQMPAHQPLQMNSFNPFLQNQQPPQFSSTNPFQPAQNGYVSTPPMLSPSTNPSSPLFQTQFASRQQSIDSVSTAPSYFQQFQRPSISQMPTQSTNPFMSQQMSLQNLQNGHVPQGTNPYANQLPYQNSANLQQQQQQQQQPHAIPQGYSQSAQYLPQQQGDQSYIHPLLPQPTGASRLPNTSIMALYGGNVSQEQQSQQSSLPLSQSHANLASITPTLQPFPATTHPQAQSPPKRSVTMPLMSFSGNRNPFQSAAPPITQLTSGPEPNIGPGAGLAAAAGVNGTTTAGNNASEQGSHLQNAAAMQPPPIQNSGLGGSMNQYMSRDSVLVSGAGSGRHSPDAWGSLSARFR